MDKDDLIELVALSKPSKVEALRVKYIGTKHWNRLSENMKERYRERAEIIVNAFLKEAEEKEE